MAANLGEVVGTTRGAAVLTTTEKPRDPWPRGFLLPRTGAAHARMDAESIEEHAVHVRREVASDIPRIRAIHVAAFADHPFSRQTEHLIVDALREANALTLSLVAEEAGVVLGHVAFSPVTIGETQGDWYILGPIGVEPNAQRAGIGSALVLAGLTALRERGAAGCVLVGDPHFYQRFGFQQDSKLTVEGVPAEYVLCVDFGSGVPEGEVAHHEAFQVER